MVKVLGLALALLAGCAAGPSGSGNAHEEQEIRMGVVENVRQVPIPGSSGYAGALGGGAAGGIAGGSVGSGRGSSAAAVLGTIAGSVAGRAIESASTSKEGLEIAVRLDSGRLLLIAQPAGEVFKPGDRVRVVSGAKDQRVVH